jgi:hypothetical protein
MMENTKYDIESLYKYSLSGLAWGTNLVQPEIESQRASYV